MSQLEDQITALDDAAAVRLLTTIADAELRNDEALATDPTEDLRQALGEAVDNEQAAVPVTVGDGELARAALLAMSEDDKLRPRMETLIAGPKAAAFVGPEVILTVGAVLVALQIGWKYTSADGRFKFEKKPLVGQHFVDFAGHLFGWFKSK